jgi:hypothetical protein
MSTSPHFDPIFAAHAIERCSATIVFDQALPQKIMSSLRTAHRARLLGAGLQDGPPMVGMKFDVATGNVVPLGGDGPVSYTTSDRGTTITLAPNQVNLTTMLYTRWAPFEGMLSKLLIPLIAEYSNTVSISAIQLDYTDRFIWSGTWDDFDSSTVLTLPGELVAARPARARQWHSHSGWFDFLAPGKRRLYNVNIDTAVAVVPNSVVSKPSLAILTVIQDGVFVVPPRAAPDWFAEGDVVPALRQQHFDLKDLLRQIISSTMAQKIGL